MTSAGEVGIELMNEEHWKRSASDKIDVGMRELTEARTLSDKDSRREMAAFKDRWQAREVTLQT